MVINLMFFLVKPVQSLWDFVHDTLATAKAANEFGCAYSLMIGIQRKTSSIASHRYCNVAACIAIHSAVS